MSDLMKPFLAELEQEMASTRRVLAQVPGDKLDWRPHEKSMPLGILALHTATTPLAFANFLQKDSLDKGDVDFRPEEPESVDKLLSAFDAAMTETQNILSSWTDEHASGEWKFTDGDKDIMVAPRLILFRQLGLNHCYHHRAQLGVYLRLLDVPVPAVYGPSADENPFAAA
jgi:uncharacterized damage-inducible protein DinB